MVAVDSSPLFIARTAEVARLQAAFARATEGQPSLVIVGGEAGIGKTRLVEEFGSRVRGRAHFLIGRCFPGLGPGLPYAPFEDLFQSLEHQLGRDRLAAVLGPARDRLGLVVPEMGPTALDAQSSERAGESRAVSRARLFELVLGVAHRLQASRPTVIAIEDLHWADEASLGLLRFLVRGIRDGRLLLMLTVRTDELRPGNPAVSAIDDLERAGRVERIELDRFSRSELADQIAAILGTTPGPGVVDRVLLRSDGNPLFAEELLASERRDSPAEVPPRLDDLLRARLGTVSAATLRVLRVAALAGPEIDDELVASVSELSNADVAEALRRAVDAGLLVRSARGPVRYAFRHRLLQEATERELLPGERRHLHGACAEALEHATQPVPFAGEVARHWLMAERPDRALPAAVTAGIDAERRCAFADARRYFDLALRISETCPLPAGPLDLDRVALLQRAADVAVLEGDPASAVDLGRRALAELGRGVDPRREAGIQERLRWYLWESGDVAGAEAALEEAIRTVPAQPPSATRARVLGQFGGLRLRQGRFSESLGYAEGAIEVARASGALPELAFALGVRGWDRVGFGQGTEGIADLREGLAIAEFLEAPEGRALGLANLAALLLYAGRLDEAYRTAVDGLESVRAIGLERTYGGSLAATAAAAAYRSGRWSEARRLAEQALAIVVPGPEAVWPGSVAMRLAAGSGDEVLMRSGIAVAEPFMAAATDRAHRVWFCLARIEADRASGLSAHAQGHAAAAIDELPSTVLDEPTASLFGLAIGIAADRAAIARAAGDVELATSQVEIADQTLGVWQARRGTHEMAIPDPAVVDALDALCTAEASRARDASDSTTWERAGSAFDDLGLVYPSAYARFRQAEAILHAASPRGPAAARDARSAAARPLRAALESAQALGARPLIADVVLLARRARLDVAAAEAEAGDPGPLGSRVPERPVAPAAAFVERRGLTPREVEILALVGSGWSNGEIASALYISRKTASVHVSNILGKLSVDDRVEAGALAHRAGLVGPPRPGSTLPELDADT